jgi:hypothetical protein
VKAGVHEYTAAEQPTEKVVSARLASEHTVSNGGARMIQGDVQITFAEGRTEVITHDGKCLPPDVSKNGAVFWMHCTGLNDRGYTVDETYILRNPQGKIIELNGGEGFLRNSAFSADGTALVTMWGGHHGPSSFVKYDVNGGKIITRLSGVYDYNKLPSWAKPLAKGDASFENSE